MELLQNLLAISEFSPLHKFILIIASVLLVVVLVSWITLSLNCIIGNIVLARLDKKKDEYENLLLNIESADDIPVIPPRDFPVFVNVALKYKALLHDDKLIRQILIKTGVLEYYKKEARSPDRQKRMRAVRILGNIGGDDADSSIKPLINDRSVFVRDEALLALSKSDSLTEARYILGYLRSCYDGSNIRWIDLILQNIAQKYPMIFTDSLGTKNMHLKHKILDIIRYMHLDGYTSYIEDMIQGRDNDEESIIKCIFILSLYPTPRNKSLLLTKLIDPAATKEIRQYIALAIYKIDPHLINQEHKAV